VEAEAGALELWLWTGTTVAVLTETEALEATLVVLAAAVVVDGMAPDT